MCIQAGASRSGIAGRLRQRDGRRGSLREAASDGEEGEDEGASSGEDATDDEEVPCIL